MRQRGLGPVVLTIVFFQSISVYAETSLDVLEQDLNQVQKDRETASSEAFKGILDQLNTAAASPDAALALYQQAGGLMPVARPAPRNPNQTETADQKAAREQENEDAQARLAATLQAHCQVMRFAVIFSSTPDQKGLQDDWLTWLKSVGPVYPQLHGTGNMRGRRDPNQTTTDAAATDTDATPDATTSDSATPTTRDNSDENRRRRFQQEQGGQGEEQLEPIGNWKTMTMGESQIGKYLGYHGWEGKDQAEWAVSSIPELYLAQVLKPLQATPSADTLTAWDVYIAMENADQPDTNEWNQVEYPSLAFDRGCDDYKIKPSMDKLQTLIAIIKAVPTHPKLEEMISRLHTYVEDFRTHHANGGDGTGGQPAAVATTSDGEPSTDGGSTTPKVTVETTQEGDMTVITTRTNAPPSNPTPPSAGQ